MNEEKFGMLRNRLIKQYRHLKKLANRQSVTCYRLYDRDIPEFPFCIELYRDQIYLAEYARHFEMGEGEHEVWLHECLQIISLVLDIPSEKIHLHQRKRKAGRAGQYEKLNCEQQFIVVEEARLKFKVNLTDYLDTGLFLDHRITRAMVRDLAKGKDVLNLFCYTGSFSVYAAAGGAGSVTSVDLSRTYLNWAEANMELNHLLDKDKHHFIQADVKEYLGEIPPEQFDLVIMDPPTFSNSKRMKDFLDIQRDHADVIDQTLRAMRPGGVIFFSTNFSKFQLALDLIRASSVKDISKATTAFDFQGRGIRFCYRIVK
jgi:23S rRNA (cytosine1962-C5)-methyltransferase